MNRLKKSDLSIPLVVCYIAFIRSKEKKIFIMVQAALVIRGGYVPREYRGYQNRGY
jgi:hypothetical protein